MCLKVEILYSISSLDYKMMVYCEDNYYGKQCDRHCYGQDSLVTGHFTCDPDTGDKICLPGKPPPNIYLVHCFGSCSNEQTLDEPRAVSENRRPSLSGLSSYIEIWYIYLSATVFSAVKTVWSGFFLNN